MSFRRHNFTLIELAVVVAILILLTAVSSVYLGRDRRGSEFERSLRDFQVFCARARAASMQDGLVRKIVFYPEENIFRIEKVESWNESGAVALAEDVEAGNSGYVVLEALESGDDGEESEDVIADELIEERFLSWKFPEKLEVKFALPDFENEEITEESVELWRYNRGGTGRLTHSLSVQRGEEVYNVTISDFTGIVEVRINSGTEERTVW